MHDFFITMFMLRDDQLIKWGKLNGNGGIIVGLCLFITGAAVFLFGEKMIGNILEKNVALSERNARPGRRRRS